MRFLFVCDFHVPQARRGSEVNTHLLCQALNEAGHEAEVLCGLQPHGLLGAWSRAKLKLHPGRRFTRDRACGYPAWRGWWLRGILGEVVAAARPDVLVVQSVDREVAVAAARLGLPMLLYIHAMPGWADMPLLPARVLTNSLYTQRRIGELYGADSAVIRPIVPPARYRTAVEPREATLVGLTRHKGAEIVLDLAVRLPRTPFRIFANQHGKPGETEALVARARALPNVLLSPPVASGGGLYRRARVVLAPSLMEETWGRIATEAQVNGIPVISTDRGGLPESVGEGGIFLPADSPPELWAATLLRLFEDEAEYSARREAALRYAARAPVQPETILRDFLAEAAAAG